MSYGVKYIGLVSLALKTVLVPASLYLGFNYAPNAVFLDAKYIDLVTLAIAPPALAHVDLNHSPVWFVWC